jgi:hypothetical protein
MSDPCNNAYKGRVRVFNVRTSRGQAEMAAYIEQQTTCASKQPVTEVIAWQKGRRGKTTAAKMLCIIVK